MQQDVDIHYRHAGLIEAVEFDSLRFYKSDKVKQVSRQRMRGKSSEVAAANDRKEVMAV